MTTNTLQLPVTLEMPAIEDLTEIEEPARIERHASTDELRPASKRPSSVKLVTAKPSSVEDEARAARRARALKSKTVMAIYLVVTFCVGAVLLEMHGRAATQAAARPAPRRVVSAPSVTAPAPAAEAPHAKGPVAPAPPGAPAPWGGWIG